jgi:hypothetical protein
VLVLDTDVIVDILRRYQPAVQWLEQNRQEQFVISGFSAMEVLAGCKDKQEQDAIQRQLFSRFRIAWLAEAECERALQMYSTIHLSNQLGIIDALIGRTALFLNLPLCTFNIKHYVAIPGLKVVRPYER